MSICLVCRDSLGSIKETATNYMINSESGQVGVCDQCREDAKVGLAVRFEIEKLEIRRDKDEPLSDAENDWLNDLQSLKAGLVEE